MQVDFTEKLVSANTILPGQCFIYGENREVWMVTNGASRREYSHNIFVPVVRLRDGFEDGIGKDAQVIPVCSSVRIRNKD